MASALPRRVAVIYGTKGGLGDVGKFAAAQAFKKAGVDARIVAMSALSIEGDDKGFEADVKDISIRQQLQKDLAQIPVRYIDVESKSAQMELERIFDGVDAVVSCLGNRQPGMARWLASGARKVTAAMKAKNVSRLVQLSSFGIGDDYMPISPIKVLWASMLRTVVNSARIDLNELEKVVQGSKVDYLLVRTVGIDPGCAPKGKWKILTSRNDGKVILTIAKADVAAFMLEEALTPTLRKTAVTIGRDPADHNMN